MIYVVFADAKMTFKITEVQILTRKETRMSTLMIYAISMDAQKSVLRRALTKNNDLLLYRGNPLKYFWVISDTPTHEGLQPSR